jgi:DNA-binding NtrC family response regulator
MQLNPNLMMKTSVTRPLLLLKSPRAEVDLPTSLSTRGWDLRVADHPEAALELMEKQDFHVGLVHWDAVDVHDCADPHQAQRMLDLLDSGNQINWVALLYNDANVLRQGSRLIASHFYDYHTLPLDVERLLMTLGHAYGMAAMVRSGFGPSLDWTSESGMVGRSPAMLALFDQIRKVAVIDLNVMINGESGTGKELTAQAIHRLSHRAGGPFVAVNCGALPKDLIQTELFGHEKGSFTGADRRRLGRIEAAQRGTLFLDEIGDLPFDLQVNLLRFLQERTIDRIGSSSQIPVDVRVIAATNVDLERAVKEGRFRADLYYRLNVLHLEMPPVRARGDDVALLAKHFLTQFAGAMKPSLRGFSPQAIEAIESYPWPGNVREMVNRIQRAVVMCEGRLVRPRDLGLDYDSPNLALMTLAEARAKAEKEAIETTLAAVRNNVSKAAKRLDISRVTLYRLMDLHSVEWQRTRAT